MAMDKRILCATSEDYEDLTIKYLEKLKGVSYDLVINPSLAEKRMDDGKAYDGLFIATLGLKEEDEDYSIPRRLVSKALARGLPVLIVTSAPSRVIWDFSNMGKGVNVVSRPGRRVDPISKALENLVLVK